MTNGYEALPRLPCQRIEAGSVRTSMTFSACWSSGGGGRAAGTAPARARVPRRFRARGPQVWPRRDAAGGGMATPLPRPRECPAGQVFGAGAEGVRGIAVT